MSTKEQVIKDLSILLDNGQDEKARAAADRILAVIDRQEEIIWSGAEAPMVLLEALRAKVKELKEYKAMYEGLCK